MTGLSTRDRGRDRQSNAPNGNGAHVRAFSSSYPPSPLSTHTRLLCGKRNQRRGRGAFKAKEANFSPLSLPSPDIGTTRKSLSSLCVCNAWGPVTREEGRRKRDYWYQMNEGAAAKTSYRKRRRRRRRWRGRGKTQDEGPLFPCGRERNKRW